MSLARKAFKPVYLFYYRFLFGRRFPFAEGLAARVRAFEAATGRGDAPLGKEAWEEQYRRGSWDFMRRLDEVARYSVIAGYLHHLKPGGSVLDVGSGEGLLADHLRPLGYSRFLGVDLSEAAIAQAAGRRDATTAFAAADAETSTRRRDAGTRSSSTSASTTSTIPWARSAATRRSWRRGASSSSPPSARAGRT